MVKADMKFEFKEILKGDKKIKIAVAVGVLLMLIIAFSGSLLKSKPDKVKQGETVTTLEYKDQLQREIKTLIEQIGGVGTAQVMITLKSDSEYIYAKEEKKNTDKTNNTGQQQSTQQSDKYENTTIMVEDENGRKTALVKTKLEPKINGVLVVCDGGDDPVVMEKVTTAIKTVLGIGSNNVFVVK